MPGADDRTAAEPLTAPAAPPVVWQAGRFDRWLHCPGSLAMEAVGSPVSKPDQQAFSELAQERGRLALQILADGATAALMHLNPGSVCLGCRAVDTCPRQRLDADDLV